MTRIGRALILIGLTAALMVGSNIPAWAGFTDSTVPATTGISTVTVAAPTKVEGKGTCSTTVDPVTGVATTTVTAKIEWQRSATRGVSGYRVTAHLNDGSSVVMEQTGPLGDEIFHSADQDYLLKEPRFSVTTLTSYGWTATSTRSDVLTC